MQTGAFSHLYLLGLPVGEASGTVVTRDEYDRKAAGLGAGFGRMYDDGIYSGGAAACPTAVAALLGRYWGDFLRQMELTSQPPAQIAAALAERSAYLEWALCAAVGVPTGGGLWNGIDRYNAKHGVAGSISKRQ